MQTARRREPAKTWSLLGDVRRKPSEYDVVTARLHYHFRRQPAPFELDPNTPINRWYMRYREGSEFQVDNWEGFRDPHQFTYRLYVERQAERENYLENLVDEFEARNYEVGLQREWVELLDRVYLPARFPMHALQMASLYVGQMAPSSFITNAAFFQAADEQRRIQWLAYTAKFLSLGYGAELASSTHTRQRWEADAVWQPLREAVEKMLIAYDWGEAFAALNLVVKPVFDEVLNMQLAELARAQEHALLGLMLDDFAIDIRRSRDWSASLVQYAIAQRPTNRHLLKKWVDQWMPMAYRSMETIVELYGQAPCPLEPGVVATKVQAAQDAFLARCGLDAAAAANTELQKSGIDAIGDMVTWGAHFCLFYETKEDLLDALILYCKSGLKNNEYCLWVVTAPLTIEEATAALKKEVPEFDRHVAEDRIGIVSANDFFLQDGKFDRERVAEAMVAKLAGLSARGYAGVRLTGDTSWVTKKDWMPFCELEEGINQVIGNQRLAVLCSYSLAACGANEILDAVRTHQFAIARREGKWVVIEAAALKQAKAEIKQLSEQLERRVVERTSELMKAEQRYRVMIETASDAVLCMDESGAVVLANPSVTEVFGYEPAELVGKPLTVLMPEVLRKGHEDGFRRYLATGHRHLNWEGTELTGLHKNGQEFPVEVSFGEMIADGHRIFTGFVRDISEKKRAEDALRRSEAYLAQAQRLTHMASWVWQVKSGDAVHLSDEWYRIYGFDPSQGMPGWEQRLQRVHSEDRNLWRGAIERAIRDKSDYDLEYRILLPDGTLKWVQVVGHPVLSAAGEVVQFVGSSMDITERKQADEAFRLIVVGTAATTGSDFFQSLVQHMAQALRARYAFVTACDDQKHARSLAFWKGDGFGENFDFDISDTPCEKVLHGEVCCYRQGLQALFPRDKVLADWQAESYLGVPMLDRSNRVIGHIAILDDKPMEADLHAIDLIKIFASRAAAELKRQRAEDELQAALQEREKMREELAHLAHLNRVSTMGELAASLAHEIKQPISAAMTDARTCSRWLNRDRPDLAEAQAAASRVVKDVARASEIIGRVRSLFKKDNLQHEEVDINELIQEMIALLRGEASRHSILIHGDFSPDLPPIMADRVQLQQVLMNLMLNSIEAMKSMNMPGKLTIKSQQDDSGQILISVMDTGGGVPAEEVEQIFDTFFTSKAQGTGMGLPISRSIISSHGGRLWAATNPESGAIFHFTLPTGRNAQQAA